MVTEEERKLAIARLENMPPNVKLSIGGKQAVSKDELINHIKKGDIIGDKFVEIQLHYLRSVAKKYS